MNLWKQKCLKFGRFLKLLSNYLDEDGCSFSVVRNGLGSEQIVEMEKYCRGTRIELNFSSGTE